MFDKEITPFLPIAEGIERLLHPYAEVVVHNIKKNQIVAIYNPFSRRKIGDSSLLSKEEEMTTLENCVGPYEKINWDGRRLKSVSSLICDKDGNGVGMLCINLDISKLDSFNTALSNFIGYGNLIPQPTSLFKDDWQEQINQTVHHYLHRNHLTLDTISRSQKKNLIEHLHKMGAFTKKKSAQYIARIIKVSRATVYNYLAESLEER